MLVLSRKVEERILIEVPGLAEPIAVKVNKLTGNRVSLAVEAPRACRIRRGELKPHQPPRPAAA